MREVAEVFVFVCTCLNERSTNRRFTHNCNHVHKGPGPSESDALQGPLKCILWFRTNSPAFDDPIRRYLDPIGEAVRVYRFCPGLETKKFVSEIIARAVSAKQFPRSVRALHLRCVKAVRLDIPCVLRMWKCRRSQEALTHPGVGSIRVYEGFAWMMMGPGCRGCSKIVKQAHARGC